jgi:hypothetical protein
MALMVVTREAKEWPPLSRRGNSASLSRNSCAGSGEQFPLPEHDHRLVSRCLDIGQHYRDRQAQVSAAP